MYNREGPYKGELGSLRERSKYRREALEGIIRDTMKTHEIIKMFRDTFSENRWILGENC